MPTYVYSCSCGCVEEQMRKIADRDRIKICKWCRKPMDRDVAVFTGAVYSPTSTGSDLKV